MAVATQMTLAEAVRRELEAAGVHSGTGQTRDYNAAVVVIRDLQDEWGYGDFDYEAAVKVAAEYVGY